jgi:tRNA(Ile)-lysidine synthase
VHLLSQVEAELTPYKTAEHIYIGYSGGIDSHVLLHLCALIKSLKNKLTAVYVHHGLQPEADSWAGHCEKTATDLGVNFLMLRVNALAMPGESPEEVARNVRYTALQPLIGIHDVLLIAQHREDQMETVLLQLFRGSGLRGLSGMPKCMTFGQGVMLRPLLDVAKPAILDHAKMHALHWIEDPSNESNHYDRNYLRNTVIPLLKQRWPALDKTIARSARHCAEAQVLISAVSEELFLKVFNAVDRTLCINRLQLYSHSQQQLVLRQWFQNLDLKMPAQAFIKRILTEIVAAREDSNPVLSGQGYWIRRYRNMLYCLKQSEPEILQDSLWPTGTRSFKLTNHRLLSWLPSSTGILYEQWNKAVVTVKFRKGGEKISLPDRTGRHSLKKLFQEAAIPTWERAFIPLIYLDDRLAAIGDRWISAEFYSEKSESCIRFFLQKSALGENAC